MSATQSLVLLSSLLLTVSPAPDHGGGSLPAPPSPTKTIAELALASALQAAGGEEVTVTRDRYINVRSSAGHAWAVAFDLLATNGVVHLGNSVI